jgi:ABC-type dipeptide/oligopeptide/nickel transport system permease component
MGTILLYAVVLVLANLTGLTYAFLDPRVRLD